MTEQEFWNLIEQAKMNSNDSDGRPASLKALLSDIEPNEIMEFYEHYIDQIQKAYTWELWGAAYVINGGCSDDGFDYFRDWLISKGQEVYTKALSDPETLADLPESEEPELEEFRYIADEVYEAKTGSAMQPKQREYPSDPEGEEWDEDSVDKLYPKLAAKYW